MYGSRIPKSRMTSSVPSLPTLRRRSDGRQPAGEVPQQGARRSLDVAGAVGNGQQAACGAAALDLQGDRILGALSIMPIMEAAVSRRPSAAVVTALVLCRRSISHTISVESTP